MNKSDALRFQSLQTLAHSINGACRAASCGRTSIYAAIKKGELIARKLGSRTVILDDDLRGWLRSLPRTASSCSTKDAIGGRGPD